LRKNLGNPMGSEYWGGGKKEKRTYSVRIGEEKTIKKKKHGYLPEIAEDLVKRDLGKRHLRI